MPKPNYIIDNDFYGIGNFNGCNCHCGTDGGDFLATFGSAIFTNICPGGTTANDASKIKVEDKKGYFSGDDVESVLEEIGQKLNKAVVDITFTDEDHLNYETLGGNTKDAGIVPSANLDVSSIDGGNAK